MGQQRKYRSRGWYYVDGQWNLSGILGEFGAVFFRVIAGGCAGTIFNGGKEKKEGLQSAIFTIFVGGISVSIDMKRVRASMTVEASLILPLVLFLFGLVMQMGIAMYEECRDTAAAIQEESDIEIVEIFYHWKKVGEWIENGDSIY